jgi:Xaa-Pro aminopeptidase
MNHEGRIERARAALNGSKIDALLVTNLTNVRYLTGFSGSNGQVLITKSGATFFSDGRYAARAADLVHGAEVAIYDARLTDLLPDSLARASIARLGVESTTVTLDEKDQLAKKISAELVPVKGVVEELRRVKEPEEITAMREAVRLADQAFDEVLSILKVGATEREVALELEIIVRRAGAEDVSFEPIVGSGPLSAHIHHSPSDRAIEAGDLVLMDFGALHEGYHSDLTRTVVMGSATDHQKEHYDLVLRSQSAGTEAVAAGATGVAVDAAARAVIESAGKGSEFGHGLGHGVGLDIHEAPRLHKISEDTLQAGEIVTVEPGVYVVGTGGIRIEDCVLVTQDGAEVLSKAPKHELIEIPI